MKKQQIKQKLKNYHADLRKELGGFKVQEILYDYTCFLKSEKYIKEILKDYWKYAEEQKDLMLKGAKNVKPDNIVIDPRNPESQVAFVKEFKLCQEKDEQGFDKMDIYKTVPLFLTFLSFEYDIMSSLKNNKITESIQNLRNDLDVSTLMKNVKESSASATKIKIMPDKEVVASTTILYQGAIEVINKYIIDQIDSEEFLNKNEAEKKLSFDPDKSELNIFGQIVKIQLKSDKPNDHYILEYLFEQNDIFETADFRDIAESKLKIPDYDSSKNWNIFRHTCERLNKKVDKSTGGKEKDFLIFKTGKTGWCKINPKYQ